LPSTINSIGPGLAPWPPQPTAALSIDVDGSADECDPVRQVAGSHRDTSARTTTITVGVRPKLCDWDEYVVDLAPASKVSLKSQLDNEELAVGLSRSTGYAKAPVEVYRGKWRWDGYAFPCPVSPYPRMSTMHQFRWSLVPVRHSPPRTPQVGGMAPHAAR